MNIDDVVLNFNPGTLVILNVVLGLIMFGIALDTSPDDFKVVARKPEAVRHRDPGAADRAAGRDVLPDADPAGARRRWRSA